MSLLGTYTDLQLLELLKKGDEAAFVEIYERYWNKLYVRAGLLLGNNDEAEEVVHDIFIQLWHKKGDIHIRFTFNTYISAMLRYHCFSLLAKRRKNGTNLNSGSSIIEIADNSTEEYLDFESLRDQIENAVSALPEKCQHIFRLSREEGLTDKEIAAELNLSIHTVRTQMKRALQKLRTSLNGFFIL